MNYISIVIALLVFGVLVFVHELGHFLVAKRAGVRVLEFAIGMGPKIIKWGKGETVYALCLFPIGGYCMMEGEEDESTDTGSFSNKPALSRFAILCAGSVMNILFGLLLSLVLVLGSHALASNTVGSFFDDSVSQQYGLKTGDQILAVGDKKVFINNDVSFLLIETWGEPVDITVKRDGQKMVLQNVQFPVVEEQGIKAAMRDFYFAPEGKTIGNVLKHTVYQAVSLTREVWRTLIYLFSGKVGISNLSGPVGTTAAIGQAAAAGWDSLVFFAMFISINLGIFNLLPFPALDGGRIALLAVEKIKGSPVKKEVEAAINFVGFALLILLMLYVTFHDITRLIK